MTSIPFGDVNEHAVVFYDRATRVCVVIANSLRYIDDALALVKTMKNERTYIIAPPGLEEDATFVLEHEDRVLYTYDK